MALVKHKAVQSPTWWVGVAMIAVTATTFVVAQGYGRAGVMPGLASLAICGLAVLHTVVGLLIGVVANDEDWHDDAERIAYARRRWIYVATVLGVVVSVWLVGFHVTLPVFLFLFIGFTLRQWLLGLILGALIWAFTYLVLAQTLHIVFPASVLRKFLIANGWF